MAFSNTNEEARPVRVLTAVESTEGCTDACETHANRQCDNGGKCVNKFSSVACDCFGTGFEGRNCSNRKYHFSKSSWLFLNIDIFIIKH